MKIIGIVSRSCDDYFKVNKTFVDIISKNNLNLIGVVPTAINKLTKIDLTNLYNILDLCSGIILQGGTEYYDYDIEVIKYCIKKDIPILGICLGMQTMASIKENNLEIIDNNKHQNTKHEIVLDRNSRLFSIIKNNKIIVNSYHKEKIKNSGIYKVSSYSNDGIIEGIEYNKNKFNIGVQFHPEKEYNDANMKKIFDEFFRIIKE